MKRFFFLAFGLLTVFGIKAQTHITTYSTPFQTTDQNLWKAGSAGLFQIDHPFFNLNWDESVEFGPMTEIAGYDFGARVDAGTWGEIGSGFRLNFGAEQVDILYDADMLIERPDNFAFNKGDMVIFRTTSVAKPSSTIVTDLYDINMQLWLAFGMGIDLSANVCVFDCVQADLVDIDLPTEEYDMVYASSLTGISLLDGIYEWGPDEAFPFSYSDANGIINLDITLPSNAGANIYLQNGQLHSFANPSLPYFNTYFSIPKFIGALHIPYVSAFFANMSNSYSYGPFYLNYILMESGFNLGLYHKQHLTFDPVLKGRLDFPLPLDYEVIDPVNGQIKEQGTAETVNYKLGDEVRFEYPCHFDFMEVTPSFEIDNTFTNNTYDSIALDFVFQMLEFDMGMEEVTVIEEYCVDVPYPCPTWNNPLKICWKEVCTPAVGFDGFQYVMGPLVDWQPNMFELTYPWRHASWEMEGFNSYDHMTPLRLEPAVFDAQLTVEDVLCYGGSDGTATVQLTNGKPPYTYMWSTGVSINSSQTTNTQTGLPAGTHYVNVIDANGCSVFASEVIIQPPTPVTAEFLQSNPICFDSYDGSIEATVSGGTPGYTYLWSNGTTASYINDLDAGEYELTVTDANGCTLTESFELTKPDALVLQTETQDVNCFGESTGSISTEAEGGISPYIYSWSNGDTGNEIQNLSAGSYTLTLKDAHNCELTENYEISEPDAPLSMTYSITHVACYGASEGEIVLNVSGGTADYSYTWFNSDDVLMSQTGPSLSNIPAGNYGVTVTDANNCSETAYFEVEQAPDLTHEFTVQDVMCYGDASGEILIELQGGTAPFSYSWSNGSTGNNPVNLTAGDYSVAVIDANGCQYEMSTVISQPEAAFTVNSEVTDVLCYGETTGMVISEAAGGTAPYSYEWSNGAAQKDLINVPAGVYTLLASDANGCEFYGGAVVGQPEMALSWEVNLSPVSCYAYEDGALSLHIEGGTLPYELEWENENYTLSEEGEFTENLASGYYAVILTDANGCELSESFYIDSPEPVVVNLTASTVSCYGGSDGQIITQVSGGTEPYTYEWSDGSTDDVLTNVQAGIYALTLTDANECSYTVEAEVESNPALRADSEVYPPSCKDKEDGSITIYPGGGSGQYSYLWSNGATTRNIENLAPGYYTLQILDALNCGFVAEFDVPYNYDECLQVPSIFTPNADGINETWVITGIDAYSNASVQVFNKWGSLVFEYSGIYQPWDGTYKGNTLPSETYYYIINLNNGDAPLTGTVTIVR